MPSSPFYGLSSSPEYASARHAVADPHHFILFQHGVMGYAGDFTNVITELFVHHDVSLHEAYEAAVKREERRARRECERREYRAGGELSSESSGLYPQGSNSRSRRARCPPTASPTTPTHVYSPNGAEGSDGRHSPTARRTAAASASHPTTAKTRDTPPEQGWKEEKADEEEDDNKEEEEEEAGQALHKDRREAQRRAARREEYKKNQFSLQCTYPFNQSGRLYETGNMVCFAPGSNNFLGTGSGTLFCARRMLREFVPVFAAWLDRVEAARTAEDEALRCAEGGEDEDVDTDDTAANEGGRCAKEANHRIVAADSMSYSSPYRRNDFPQPPLAFSRFAYNGTRNDVVAPTAAVAASPLLPSPAADGAAPLPHRLPILFSCVGHSFGGLILREFLYVLCVDTLELPREDPTLYAAVLGLRLRMMRFHVRFEGFLTIATPHCGTTECLWWPIYLGAWFLAKLRLFSTYGELIVSDSEALLMKRLVDSPHITALKLFRRRTLFANTHRDLLVGFGTSALIYETVPDDHTKAKGYGRVSDVPCASAFESDDMELSAVVHLPAHRLGGTVGSDDRTTSFPGHRGHTDRALPPVSATHTLFDIWEFHHTRSTTTLAPVDPLSILTPAAAAAADALSESFAAAASTQPGIDDGRDTRERTAAAAPVAVVGDVGEEGERPGSGEDRAVDGPWFYYERVFPSSPTDGGGGTATTAPNPSNGSEREGGHDADGRGPRKGVDYGGGRYEVSGIHPAIPPPTMQFPISKIISAEEMKAKLRVALSPSLSATAVNLSAGTAASGGPQGDRDETAESAASSVSAAAVPTMASGATTAWDVSAGFTWMWPSRAAFPSFLTFNNTAGATSSACSPTAPASVGGSGSGSGSDMDGEVPPEAAKSARRPLRRHRRQPNTAEPAPARRGRHATAAARHPRTFPLPPADEAPTSFLTLPSKMIALCTPRVPCTVMGLVRSVTKSVRGLFCAPARPLRKMISGPSPRLAPSVNGDGVSAAEGAPAATTETLPLGVEAGRQGAAPAAVTPDELEQREGEDESEYLCRLLQAHMQTLPRSRLTPRAIAHELRRDLDWRVRAVRWNHRMPIAHVAPLGNWAWAGTSPNLVKAVAEEIAHIP